MIEKLGGSAGLKDWRVVAGVGLVSGPRLNFRVYTDPPHVPPLRLRILSSGVGSANLGSGPGFSLNTFLLCESQFLQ